MKSHVFLTPSSPDRPGELVEVVENDGPQLYAEPVSPYAVNDAELSALRTAVAEARTRLRHAKSKNAGAAEIKKLERALETAKRELDTIEYELRRNRQREQIGADSPFARQTAAEPSGTTVQFAEPVPYFTRQSAVSEELQQLRARVAAAVKALGEARGSGASTTQIMRLEETVRSLKEELTQAEFGKPTGGDRDQAPRTHPPRKTAAPTAPKAENTLTGWGKFLADIDASLMAKVKAVMNTPAAANRSAVCCKGQYLCTSCREKAAGA